MTDHLNHDLPPEDDTAAQAAEVLRRKHMRLLLETQFVFYRRLVAKKHGFEVWLQFQPSKMTDSELEQAVAFLRDAAHLPPV